MKRIVGWILLVLSVLCFLPVAIFALTCGLQPKFGCGMAFNLLALPTLVAIICLPFALTLLAHEQTRIETFYEKTVDGPEMTSCPRCKKETPRALDECLWCNYRLPTPT